MATRCPPRSGTARGPPSSASDSARFAKAQSRSSMATRCSTSFTRSPSVRESFRFHPEARVELRSAATWYREQSREAAQRFSSEVTDGVRSIREHPEAWAIWQGTEVRRRILRRFPYSIFYVVDNDTIVIIAVA